MPCLAFGLSGPPALSQTVRDDFAGAQISPERWRLCEREENEFRVEAVPTADFRAARTTVYPRRDLGLFALRPAGRACRSANGAYDPGESEERAEMWEADRLFQPFGTEVWYRFSMFVDPAIPSDGGRLVIGQWKEEGGHSPFVAQRFAHRLFAITIEQDNDLPDRVPQNTDCRIVVAVQNTAVAALKSPEAEPAHALVAALRGRLRAPESASIGHDRDDVVHPGPVLAGAVAAPLQSCARDLQVVRLNSLPDPFGRWTEMLYHLKATADASGLLEVWADGIPVVRVEGRIGFRDGRGHGKQYFKFGPYRAPSNYSSYALIARYARGASRAEVE